MIRYELCRANDLSRPTLKRLLQLTNDPGRGDVTDDGEAPGSVLRDHLEERLMGMPVWTHGTWAVLAWDGDDLVAWCEVSHRMHDPDGIRFQVPTCVVGFYVSPSHRRLGIASCLLRKAEEVARKNGCGRLLANPWNRASFSFFKSAGFEDLEAHLPHADDEPSVAFKDL